MKKLFLCLTLCLLTACSNVPVSSQNSTTSTPAVSIASLATHTVAEDVTVKFAAPIAEYTKRNTLKHFGDYIQDRFTGYHVGDDIEYTDSSDMKVPVYSIADGIVEYKNWVSGYGGLIKVKYQIDSVTIHALYGHIALDSSTVKVGDSVTAGQFLANLGEGNSTETDGERKHLHFGLYEGNAARINGYESQQTAVKQWLNPKEFLLQHNVALD